MNVSKLLSLAKREIKKYKATGHGEYLIQASEKVWLAYVLKLEKITGKDIRTKKGVQMQSWNLIKRRKLSYDLYKDVTFLHSYHYEGKADDEIVIKTINSCIRRIKRL